MSPQISGAIPRATYRLQFHAGFTFADATRLVPYLDRLGISHVYASPITTARPGSSHGYDVVDPTRVNPELGGEDGLAELVGTLRAREMGLIIDIVPNHMGIGQHNGWWMDVLANGPTSRYASYFDIDWARGGGKMVLPFLGAPLGETLAAGDLRLEILPDTGEVFLLAYGDTRYPLRPETIPAPGERDGFDPSHAAGRDALARLIGHQHYNLAWWRAGHDLLNWRRFFSVTELAGLRIEDPLVFETTHALYFRLFAEGIIDGVRIDHVDGLTDPTGYLVALRERFDALSPRRPAPLSDQPAWIVVEKILGPGEDLPLEWPIDGTSGYEFMETLNVALHSPGAERELGAAWTTISERSARFAPEEILARDQMLSWEFSAQRAQAVDAFASLATEDRVAGRFTRAMIGRALDALIKVFPVYRTYGTGDDALAQDAVVRERSRTGAVPHTAPGETEVVDWILACLAGQSAGDAREAVQRFQQLSAPIAAKAVEDTAFYRYGRLLSRNDVGSEAALFALDAEAFHARIARGAERFPHAMLTTATHDHKRGEDLRARITAISHAPQVWLAFYSDFSARLEARADGIDPGDLYMMAQMLAGVWPDAAETHPHWAERLKGWQEKAIREAKLRSSWIAPDETYEARLAELIDWICTGRDASSVRDALDRLRTALLPHARRLSLAQTVMKLTLPGIPDIYQGTEIADFTLVDPDNRRAVDFPALEDALSAESPPEKLATIHALLALRRTGPALFSDGTYVPIPAPPGVVAYGRAHGRDTFLAVLAIAQGAEALRGVVLDLPAALTAAGSQFSPLGADPVGRAPCPWLDAHGLVIRHLPTKVEIA